MSRSLPPELLDIIVDHLHDEPAALKACCVVSESWVSRTRKYLFAHIRFRSPKCTIELWKQAFPDPSNSLARYTRSISFPEPDSHSAALVNPDVTGWIRSFHRVEDLVLNFSGLDNHEVSLAQLHGFSSALRSLFLLHLLIPLSKIFNFISSFPLLEDLSLTTSSPHTSDTDKWISSSTSPKFTGSLRVGGAVPSITRWLCGLPGGLHFREIDLSYHHGDTPPVTGLVSKCSSTLEFLTISSYCVGEQPSLDLSQAMKLKNVVFGSRGSLRWINTAIESIKSKDLHRVIVRSSHILVNYREWEDLDHLLTQLWTSRSIRPTIMFKGDKIIGLVPKFLPELTKNGAVDVFEYDA